MIIKQELDDMPNLTCGDWSVESDAVDFFVRCIDAADGMFRVYREADGKPVSKHHFQEYHDIRADVLLIPTAKIIAAGWWGGVIVVEVKRSGEKIGPGCNQLLDYMNSAFSLHGGVAVLPGFGFLFPASKQHGAMASVMAQQHVGTAFHHRRGSLDLFCGECRVLSIGQDGRIDIGNINFGCKIGSR